MVQYRNFPMQVKEAEKQNPKPIREIVEPKAVVKLTIWNVFKNNECTDALTQQHQKTLKAMEVDDYIYI